MDSLMSLCMVCIIVYSIVGAAYFFKKLFNIGE
jgi:hypothetical protein